MNLAQSDVGVKHNKTRTGLVQVTLARSGVRPQDLLAVKRHSFPLNTLTVFVVLFQLAQLIMLDRKRNMKTLAYAERKL